MNSSRENFEVQVMRQGRWITQAVKNRESEAGDMAKTLLLDKACPGARVVRNWLGQDGLTTEKVVFEKTQGVSGSGPVRINPIESAPPRCENPRDYFNFESRMTINRIFRTYFEDTHLTPTELLHSHKELQRIQDKDSLVQSAVDMIATLQTKGTDLPPKQRREEIFASIDHIKAQARRAEKMKLPKMGESFSDALAEMEALGNDESLTPDYLTMAALSRDLLGTRNWLGKLDRLCKLAVAETVAESVLLLDTVIADVLGANVVQEVLGWQPSLGSAIIAMFDLADGKFDVEKSEAKDVVEVLNRLFAQGRLPASRYCLIDRALRQLRSSTPLSRNDPGKELDEYRKVLARLLVPGGFLAGSQAAEALTVRGTRFVEQGGATGRRAAITATVHALPDRAHGVMYLAELSKTDLAKDHLSDIIGQLDSVFGARVIGELCRRTLSPKDRMVSATGAFNAAVSSALPDEIKNKIADHIDTVLERYLVDESIIEKLDDPSTPLRDRAVRLVKFCGAGVLPEGKALNRARERVIKILRQPKFDVSFIEGISDPARAAKLLRDFHQLLVSSGFA